MLKTSYSRLQLKISISDKKKKRSLDSTLLIEKIIYMLTLILHSFEKNPNSATTYRASLKVKLVS